MGFEFRCGVGLGEFIMGRVRSSPEVARELVGLSRRAKVMVITTNDMEKQSHVRALNKLYTIETVQDEKSIRRRKYSIMCIIAGFVLSVFLVPFLAFRFPNVGAIAGDSGAG
jgi:hypothetical protein